MAHLLSIADEGELRERISLVKKYVWEVMIPQLELFTDPAEDGEVVSFADAVMKRFSKYEASYENYREKLLRDMRACKPTRYAMEAAQDWLYDVRKDEPLPKVEAIITRFTEANVTLVALRSDFECLSDVNTRLSKTADSGNVVQFVAKGAAS